MINKNFNKIISLTQKFRDDRDWKQFHDPKNVAEAIAIESSELLELFLWKDKKEIELELKKPEYLEEISDEIADVLSFVLLMAETVGIDVEEAVQKKYEKNVKKYPIEKAKGKAVKYTKL